MNNTEGVVMMKDNIRYEIKDGRITEFRDGTSLGSTPLFDTIVSLTEKVDLEYQNKLLGKWMMENSPLNKQREGYDWTNDCYFVPDCLELVQNYDNEDYNIGMYLNKGIMVMDLVFEKQYRNSHRLLKEHILLSLNDRVKNGGVTPSPFNKIEPNWSSIDDCYKSLKIESNSPSPIVELYERFSNKDYDYLTDYYLEHFSLNKYVVVDGREVV
tara:strand:- start:2111 stop:2749 length:639 start_codon:yes stop_codon:yes gene_type:complete